MIRLVVHCLFIGLCLSEKRTISSAVNPGCTSECSSDKNVLIHITADGPNDTLHHIWDFTYKPAALLAITPLNTTLSINWTDFLKGEVGAVQFSAQPLYTFSFALDQIIEFNDVNNTAIYDPDKYNTSDITLFNSHDFDWKFRMEKYQNTSTNVFAVMEGKKTKSKHEHHKTGTVVISLSAYGITEHSKIQPHLLHTVNASQVDIVLDDFPTTEHFKSRFALALTLVSSDYAQSTFSSIRWRSLDDEHSPGVFTVAGIKSSRGYLEWRTVAYTTDERIMTSSTDVTTSLHIAGNDSLSNTAIFSLMGDQLNEMLTSSVVLSFGQPGEAFYPTTRYLSWTFLGGIGSPINEGFSQLVLLILYMGIGIPILLLIFGGICIVVKRMSKKSQDIVFSES